MSENQKASGRGSPPGIPRWVRLFIIIFIVLAAAVAVVHLMGFDFGGHGATLNIEPLVQGQVKFLFRQC
jgi:hypothetical protein